MKRWQHWVIQWVAAFAVFAAAYDGTKDNEAAWVMIVIALWAHSLSNYWEGKNQARGLYDSTHKKEGAK